MKNLQHLTNVHEAAQDLHKMFCNSDWYIRAQVITMPPKTGAVTNKREVVEIVVYVRDLEAKNGPDTFKSWPVRYELGA